MTEQKLYRFYATTIGNWRQHYCYSIFADWTVCGWPVMHCSNGEVRTRIGMTCGRCRRAYRQGAVSNESYATVALWGSFKLLILSWDRMKARWSLNRHAQTPAERRSDHD